MMADRRAAAPATTIKPSSRAFLIAFCAVEGSEIWRSTQQYAP
jgi:hypothetical protein